MSDVKNIVLRPIPRKEADALVKRVHYSGKVVNNSQIHIGVFWNGHLEGAMQFGPSLDKSKLVGLVEGTKWNEFIELNRMAFSDVLPRNSESRAIAIAMRILKKHAPHLKWIVSFADATQCGDGTIYRASGFVLTDVRSNHNTWRLPEHAINITPDDARVVNVWANAVDYQVHKMSLEGGVRPNALLRQVKNMMRRYTNGATSAQTFFKLIGAKQMVGYQLRYLYFLDPIARQRLTVPILPFSEIERLHAGMYKGQSISRAVSIEGDALSVPTEGGRFNTTTALPEQVEEVSHA